VRSSRLRGFVQATQQRIQGFMLRAIGRTSAWTNG